MRGALDVFAAEHDIGAGFFVAAHSYGLKLSLVMAANARGRRLLGIDGSGPASGTPSIPGIQSAGAPASPGLTVGRVGGRRMVRTLAIRSRS